MRNQINAPLYVLQKKADERTVKATTQFSNELPDIRRLWPSKHQFSVEDLG